jgi:signal transduction histidine kinase
MKRFLRLSGGARTIRARVLVIALIPCLALLTLGVGGASYLVIQGNQAKDYASKLEEVIPPSISFLANLREERRVSLLVIAGEPQASAELQQQRAKTDQSIQEIGEVVNAIATLNPAAMAQVMPEFGNFIGQLPEIRKQVDSGHGSSLAVVDYFSRIAGILAIAMPNFARTSPDSSAAVDEANSADLGVAADQMSAAAALGAGTVTGGGMSLDEWREFRYLVEGYHASLDSIMGRLSAHLQNEYATLQTTDAWQKVTAVETALIERGPRPSPTARDNRPLPVTMADWQNAAQQVGTTLSNFWAEQHGDANAVIAASGERTLTNSLWAGGGILVLTLLALLIALRLSNNLITRLTRLRAETLVLAEEKLPALVGRLRDGKQVDIETEVAVLDFGRDEIGQVADAFNTAQRTATAAAVQEAKTREGVNAVFLNIAHRSQVVVHRQLEVLDTAERREEDPDQLELLFKLDHLATRSRRNAENLIILGGQQPGRQWRNPVPLMEVVRSAVAETEDYARVRTGRLPAVLMVGAVVADLVHLLAELVDNATSFSPPESRVEVRGNMVGTGVVIEVEDQGLGIPKEERERINESLHHPPDFGVMSLSGDARLGLFVVARLAGRHGISVTLAESAYGGTRAIVLIRQALIAPMDNGEDDTENATEATEIAIRTPRQRQAHSNDNEAWDEDGAVNGNSRSIFRPPPVPQPATGVRWPAEEPVDTPPSPGPRHAQPITSADDRPPLPRRRRQANLAPQLAADVNPPTVAEDRPAEQVRDTMAAFQRGTRQARDGE